MPCAERETHHKGPSRTGRERGFPRQGCQAIFRRLSSRNGPPHFRRPGLLQAGLLASLAFFAAASAAPATQSRRDGRAGARTRLLKLPLVFEPNVGQADPRVQFLAPSRGVMLTSTGIVLALTEPGSVSASPARAARGGMGGCA